MKLLVRKFRMLKRHAAQVSLSSYYRALDDVDRDNDVMMLFCGMEAAKGPIATRWIMTERQLTHVSFLDRHFQIMPNLTH